ncbi:MAG TPA: hypothetical protein VGO13_12180, partial [Solirubrobacterales bacterium]|nr:hypothetical protein [Solirubrobacterales bacterium]
NSVGIDGSGRDIFFQTAQPLAPGDGDGAVDVYDARVGGGFSVAKQEPCSGETCQPSPAGPPAAPAPATGQPPADPGNVKSKPCLKGKVKKHGRCVKKHTKGQKHKKQGKDHAKRASHNRGDSK